VIAATIGGTVSEATGGKFANGAQTAAFAYLFNQVMSEQKQKENITVFDKEKWKLRASIGEGEKVTVDGYSRIMLEMGDDASALHVNGFYVKSTYVLLDERGNVVQEAWPVPLPREYTDRYKTHYGFPVAGNETRHIIHETGHRIDQKFRWFIEVPMQEQTCDNCGGRYLNVWVPAGSR
jgi:hypothetical protein